MGRKPEMQQWRAFHAIAAVRRKRPRGRSMLYVGPVLRRTLPAAAAASTAADGRLGGGRRQRALQRQVQHLVDPLHRDDLHAVGDVGRISARSLRFSSGITTVRMPPRSAASSFSLRPPMAVTLPRRVISPVIAMSARTGTLVRVDTSAVTMAMPALGPSFGVAP